MGAGDIPLREKYAWLDEQGVLDRGHRDAYLELWGSLETEFSRFQESQTEKREAEARAARVGKGR